MRFRYQDLRVCEDIMALTDHVYEQTKTFPQEERYELVKQVRRAVNSVFLNLVEGTGRKSKKEFARFITISQGSLLEVHACFTLAKRRKYVTEVEMVEFDRKVHAIWIQLSALHASQLRDS